MALNLSVRELTELTEPSGGSTGQPGTREAYEFCRKLTLGHYENFPVGSILVPRESRKHIYPIYAFSRLADDIADEPNGMDSEQRLRLLDSMENLLERAPVGSDGLHNPIFLALARTMEEKKIPAMPFKKLLNAFRRDINFLRPATMADNIDYCTLSANPVGELVLRLFDSYDERTAPLSDAICTGLQLVNFWQDLSRDIKNGRLYVPADIAGAHGINETAPDKWKDAFLRSGNDARAMLDELYSITERYFEIGAKLIILLSSRRLRAEIFFTLRGGQEVLKKVRQLGTAIIEERPSMSKMDFLKLVPKYFFLQKKESR